MSDEVRSLSRQYIRRGRLILPEPEIRDPFDADELPEISEEKMREIVESTRAVVDEYLRKIK